MLIGSGLEKACMLIALDQMFTNEDWGKDFLLSLYKDTYTDGFPLDDLWLLEECAPVFIPPIGSYTWYWKQGDCYFQWKNDTTGVRYRVGYKESIIVIYKTATDYTHAVCIPASVAPVVYASQEIVSTILPRCGLIIDKAPITLISDY